MKVNSPEVAKALDQLAHFSPREIQENVFVSQYLPILAGDAGTNLNPWIDLAGGPFNPVNVLNGSEFLFQVPPLASNDNDMFKDLEQVNVQAEVIRAFQEGQNVPAMGDARVHLLANRFGRNKVNTANVVALNAIFQRYGYPLIELANAPGATVQGTPQNNLGYDPMDDSGDVRM